MKLKVSKSTLLALFAVLGAGNTVPAELQGTQAIHITQEQNTQLNQIHKSMRYITDIALYLIESLESTTVVYALDEIVIRMESAESLIIDLIKQLNQAKSKAGSVESNYSKALDLKLEVVEEIHTILKDLAAILRDGLNGAVPKKKKCVNLLLFIARVKTPLGQLSNEARVNTLEAKIIAIKSLLTEAKAEDITMIQELLELIEKLRALTKSEGSVAAICDIGKKLPKKRGPFEGIPHKLKLNDWVDEMHKSK